MGDIIETIKNLEAEEVQKEIGKRELEQERDKKQKELVERFYSLVEQSGIQVELGKINEHLLEGVGEITFPKTPTFYERQGIIQLAWETKTIRAEFDVSTGKLVVSGEMAHRYDFNQEEWLSQKEPVIKALASAFLHPNIYTPREDSQPGFMGP